MATRTEIIAAGMLSALLIFTAFAVVRLLSNGPPVADASDAPTVFAGYLAELDGAGSTDPDGDELTYEWTMQSRPEDSAIELVTPDMATVSFTPDIPGEYVVSLAVSDGELASPPAQVVVVARPWLTDVTDEAGGPGGRRQDFTDGLGPGAAWGDYDGDGDTDIYVVNANGRNALYRNEIGSRMNWIGIRLLGTASNLKGIGAKVEVTSRDGVTRTLSPAGGSGYLGQNDTDVLFGLGAADRVDIRVTWPNGVVQDFWDVWANTLGRVRESTMEGSCPLVFAWDGSDYSFVSDVMGSAVTGFALAPDVYRFPIDTDEYLKIEGLEPREGSYSIRIVELLNEIIYLDKAILLVVDHPSDLTAFPNERLHLFPPFPKARTYLAGGLRPPVAALGRGGNDILYLISARDGVYFEPNAYLPYGGFAEEYSIVLDLGDLSNLEVILLVLNGWTHYVTSYGLHQASQAGVGPMLPRLDVVDEEGEWTPVAMDMGFPGGQVPNRRLQGQDHNEPATILGPDPRGVHSRGGDAENHGAHGGGRGPALERIPEAAPDYRRPEDAARGARLCVVQADRDRRAVPEGRYTKYGDITPLLDVPDDMFVVMRHGDELAQEFSADGLPELESGWSRSIVLYLDGYLKYVGHVRGPRFERGADAVPRHVQLPLPE